MDGHWLEDDGLPQESPQQQSLCVVNTFTLDVLPD